MISVKKDYNDIPAILESEEVEKFRNDWIAYYHSEYNNNFIQPSKINKKIYTDMSVANALNEIYHNKCAICEVKLKDKFIVTHYRPITHYPWLAYEWSNLFLSCHECDKAKRDYFPLIDEKFRITKPPYSFYDWRATSTFFENEFALLINPEVTYDKEYFDVKKDGSLESNDLLRKTTINRYDLNRRDLVHARKRIIDHYILLFEHQIMEFFKNDFQSIEMDKNRFSSIANKYFDELFTELKKCRHKDQEYSFVHNFIYENFNSFIDEIIENQIQKDILKMVYDYYTLGSVDIKSVFSLHNSLIEYQKGNIAETEKISIIKQPVTVIDGSKLDSIEIKNFFCIDNIEIKNLGNTKEIYFLGENGDGKTLILQAILIALKQKSIKHLSSSAVTGKVLDMIEPKQTSNSSDALIKPIFKAIDDNNNSYENDIFISYESIFAYGVSRSRNDSDKKDESGFMTLFDSERYLNSPIKWLQYLHSKDLEKAANIYTTDTITLPVAKEILGNLLGEEKDLEIDVTADAVTFKEKGAPIFFDQLSEGYKSVMTWVCDLLSRLSENQPNVTDTKDYQGVVLVDEIDLHLHPKWANKIVSKLRTWFPNIQFFFTTHSPIVLLGASREAVFYKVYKEDGVTKISQPLESISSLTANTILTSPLFGLEDAISDAFDIDKDDPNTEDHYWDGIIHKEISKRISKNAGVTEADIIKLVNEELDKLEEVARRDKN